MNATTRLLALILLDAIIGAGSLIVALVLRFDGTIEPAYLGALPWYLCALVTSRVTMNLMLRLHRWSFSVASLTDALRVAVATTAGSAAFLVVTFLTRQLSPPRSVIVLELLMTGALMLAVRFVPRIGQVQWNQIRRQRRGGLRPTIVVGAGTAGEMLVRDLQRSAEHDYNIVGFVDDKKTTWNNLVLGRPVLGGIADLQRLVGVHGITDILIAIPRDAQGVIRQIVTSCAGLGVQIKALPVSYIYFQERGTASMLQALSPDDLLGRHRVVFEPHERSAFIGRRVLVTGAAGSIGSEICRQLLGVGIGHLTAVDINENGLFLLEHRLKRELPDAAFACELADIRDVHRLDSLIQRYRPQDVFHAAAHKHVPLMESAPCEAIKNNVLGTRHLLFAAEKLPVECLVFISTDKAVAPSNVMGATKRIGEYMTRAVTARSTVRGCAVRFGNVLGSEGSVVPLFKEQIAAGGPLTVTHPDVSRYFMTIPEAVSLVLKAAYGHYGELCVLDMGEPIRIIDLARQMIALAGLVPDKDIKITVTGLRPGEKLTEELVTDDEEVQQRAEGKIQVVVGPPPPANLWQIVDELGAAAEAEDTERVLQLVQSLVPGYRRRPPDPPTVTPRLRS